jgi:hypothetical protein
MLRRIALLSLTALAAFSVAASAQSSGPNHDWNRIQQLRPLTKVHISADHGGRTCKIFSISEDSLTCEHGGKPGMVFQRSTIKSIKRTRYLLSTVVGLGVGIGVGALIGKASEHHNDFLDFSSLDIAFGGVIGGLAGAAVGGPTDMLRGPTLYVRP